MRVAVLAYPGCLGGEVFGFHDLLVIANQLPAATALTAFEPVVVTATGRAVPTAGGATVGGRPAATDVDLVVVPGFVLRPDDDLDALLAAWPREYRYLRSVAERGVPVASICIGAFLLGAAGLLDGVRCTTAWLYARRLARRFPDTRVEPARMLVEDRGVTTTAAYTAAHDLALHLVGARLGRTAAAQVARLTLTGVRDRQTPYVDTGLLPDDDGPFAREVKAWLRRHLADPYHLPTLAREFRVSTRTLLRRFQAEAGQSPLTYLQQARVDQAKRRLRGGRVPVGQAMREVGYADAATFRRLFAERVGMSPSAYRRRFTVTPGSR